MPKSRISTTALAVLFCTTCLAAPAFADASTSNAEVTDTAGDIIVSALRVPVERDRVASSVTLLDLEQIQQAQPIALTDILETTPGISLARNGGYGTTTSLRIRGSDPGQSVLVIDGMRMADPTATNGGFDYSQLFADDIARIEVLRGPQSILWGSDAIGGIVNVTTVVPTRPLQADISIEGGSHDTLGAHAGIGGSSPLVDWRLSGSDFTTAGIPTLAGGTVANGYSRQAASLTTTFHLAANVSLDLRGYWNAGRDSYSDNFTLPSGIYAGDYSLNKQWSVYAGLNVALLDGKFRNRLAMMQNQTDNEDYDPANPTYQGTPALTFVGHGRIRRYEYQGSLEAAKGIDLLFGAERKEQRMEVGSPYDAVTPYDLTPHVASTNSVYGEARLTPLAGLTLNGGVRYDHQSQFGGNTVFSAGGAYTPDSGTTLLRVSYDEGFKAPSLYQLYGDYGATNLQPERAHGWEVGVERGLFGKAVRLSAAWYERDSVNLILFSYCPFSGPQPAICFVPGTGIQRFGYYANIASAHAQGLELTAAARIGHLFASGNYSITVAEDRTPGSATYNRQLYRVPRHLANAELGYDWTSRLTTSVALRWSGATFDNGYSALQLPAYAVVDLRAQWKLPTGLTLFGRVENIGDRSYQTAYGYNSLGRTAYLGVRGQF